MRSSKKILVDRSVHPDTKEGMTRKGAGRLESLES